MFACIKIRYFKITFKDDVTAFAKLEPTDRVQHVVCEARNEVRKVTKMMITYLSKMMSKMMITYLSIQVITPVNPGDFCATAK